MSHLLTLHLPLDPTRGDFSGDVLAERLRGLDVQDVQAFLHDYGGAPALAVVVRHTGESPAAPRKQPTDWRARLAASDVPLFETLRRWRNQRAAQEGVRPYRVVTNRALAGVAALRPHSKGELETVPGVGPWTLERYGDALLAQVEAAERTDVSSGSPGTEGPTREPSTTASGSHEQRPVSGAPSREVHSAPFGAAPKPQ